MAKYHKWTEEEKQYLKEIAPGRSTMEMKKLMTEKFDYPFTTEQIKTACVRYGFKSGMTVARGKSLHKWTEEEKDYLREIAPGRSREEMIRLMRERFDYPFTVSQIVNACQRYQIKNGRQTTFKKGHATWNKGKKGYIGANATSFKKGNIPHNHRPIGSERIDVEGYHLIKISEPNVWQYKHILIWEEVNGPLPGGHVVLFADGNKENFDLENLVLVNRRELLVLNQHQLITEDTDLTKTGLNVAKLMIQTQKMQKRLKQDE